MFENTADTARPVPLPSNIVGMARELTEELEKVERISQRNPLPALSPEQEAMFRAHALRIVPALIAARIAALAIIEAYGADS